MVRTEFEMKLQSRTRGTCKTSIAFGTEQEKERKCEQLQSHAVIQLPVSLASWCTDGNQVQPFVSSMEQNSIQPTTHGMPLCDL